MKKLENIYENQVLHYFLLIGIKWLFQKIGCKLEFFNGFHFCSFEG